MMRNAVTTVLERLILMGIFVGYAACLARLAGGGL
jgi:hypothetical protein